MHIRKLIPAFALTTALAILSAFAFNLAAARADPPPLAYTAYLPLITQDVDHSFGHFGGQATALALQGTTLYAGVGTALQVFDVSAPTQFTLLGLAPLADLASAILIHDGYAYVAVHYTGLQVFDIATPATPRTVATLNLTGKPQALAINGNVLYVATDKAGLHVVDIATPTAPRRADTISDLSGLDQLAVVGAHLYVAPLYTNNNQGIGILDISTPSRPVQIGSVPGNWDVVAAAGPNRLAVGGRARLTLLDVTQPLAPQTLAVCESTECDYVDAIYVSGSRLAVVSDVDPLISVYDISDLTKPTFQGRYSVPDSNVSALAMGNGYVYTAGTLGMQNAAGILALKLAQGELLAAGDFPERILVSPGGEYSYQFQADTAHLYLLSPTTALNTTLRVFDTAAPANPREIAALAMSTALPRDTALDGSRLYLAVDGLRVVDVSNPAAPVLGGVFLTPRMTEKVRIVNHLAAVLDSNDSSDDIVYLVDASDIATPKQVGSYAVQGRVTVMAAAGATLYLGVRPAAGGYALRIVDVATPASPHELGSYALPGEPQALDVSGGRAYVYVTGPNEYSLGSLLILDVTNPADVRQLSARPERDVRQIQAVGNTVYLNPTENYGYSPPRWLKVLDVATPSTPRVVGFVHAPKLDRFQVVGAVAYADMGKLRTLDLSNPGAPQLFGFLGTPSAIASVVQGNLAYVTAGSQGIQTLDVSDPLQPRGRSSIAAGDGAASITRCPNGLLAIDGDDSSALYDTLPGGRLALRSYSRSSDPVGMVLCAETRLYEADDFGDIQIYDISNPDHITWLGSAEVGHGNEPFAVQGNMLYVASSKFYIFDVTDPAHVQRLAVLPDIGGDGLAVDGSHAYVTDYSDGLLVIDVSNPRAPRVVAVLPLPGADLVAVSEGYAYVGTLPVWQADSNSYTPARLYMVDISNPLAPRSVNSYVAPSTVTSITVAGQYVYAADGRSGLYIFKTR